MTEYRDWINGIEVTAVYSEETVEKLFLPFLKTLTDMQRAKGSRLLVMLAAPPGAGKTTLASFLRKLSMESPALTPLQVIGMDGFHRRQEDLMSHTAVRDGKEISLVKIKGAPVTFDLTKLKERVREVASGKVCPWPVYDRLLHNPVENALQVDGELVLLEGNYLLLTEPGWCELSGYADYTVLIRAEEAFLRARLIERRVRTGVERNASVEFVDFSDMPNVRLCLERSGHADLELNVDAGGEYHLSGKRYGER